MKLVTKILFLMILISSLSYGQTRKGSTATPYSIQGWDTPVEYTPYYKLFVFRLLSNPGGWHNLQTVKIDSLFNALIVKVDSLQMVIEEEELHFSDYMSYHNSFSGTAQYDTTSVPGIDSLDVVVISARESVLGANDLLSVKVIANKVIAQRPASGTSGLKYNFIWIRKYQ